MRGTPTMSTWDNLRLMLTEASRYAPGDPDREWRIAAAWKLLQLADGIPACDWTPPPAGFGPGYQKEAA
ncbi:MAG: hypothetical protein FJX25_02360 [Alphaproteobacteria bacterium]|nr:hypothetical protein [Alphaproteobacteria bacterium]